MKHCFTIFVLFAASPVFGQSGNTKLLTGETFSPLHSDGTPSAGYDSTHYSYNAENRLSESVSWHYVYVNSNWIPQYRFHAMTYDVNGNLLTEERQKYMNTSWVSYARFTYIYNAEGQKTKEIKETWGGFDWFIENTTTWEFDALGHLLSEKSPTTEILYTYNVDGYVSTKTTRQEFSGGWTNLTHLIYEYLPQSGGLPTSIFEQHWSTGFWIDAYRSDFEYDFAGNTLSVTSTSSDGTNWYNSFRLTNTYNPNGKLIHGLSEYAPNGTWINFAQVSYSYDTAGDIITEYEEEWYEADGIWYPTIRVHYYYSELLSTILPKITNFFIFPNPTTTFLTLQGEYLAQAKIFDQQGRQVRAQILHGQAEETIQLGNLPTGNYLLQAIGADGKVGAKSLQIRH